MSCLRGIVIFAFEWRGCASRLPQARSSSLFKYVPSKENIADIFTKILTEVQFRYLHDKMMSLRSRL